MKAIWLVPFLMLSLLLGIGGGWMRMGWEMSLSAAAFNHGLLMIGGFMGAVITLERMLTMRSKWWLMFPFGCSIAVIFFMLGFSKVGMVLILIGSLGLSHYYFKQLARLSDAYLVVMLIGALLWLVGNIQMLIHSFVPSAINWWVGFVLFTILGERLELTKFLPVPKRAYRTLWVLFFFLVAALFLPFHGLGRSTYAILIFLIAFWFLRYDMARHSIKKYGYHRYTGLSMLTAYAWLILHGIASLWFMNNTFSYDVFIHTFFLGFGFSMIWAHAPIILPSVLKLSERPYHSFLWVPWSLFQLTLVGRVISSLLSSGTWRMQFGLINGISMLLMLATLGVIVFIKNKSKINATEVV